MNCAFLKNSIGVRVNRSPAAFLDTTLTQGMQRDSCLTMFYTICANPVVLKFDLKFDLYFSEGWHILKHFGGVLLMSLKMKKYPAWQLVPHFFWTKTGIVHLTKRTHWKIQQSRQKMEQLFNIYWYQKSRSEKKCINLEKWSNGEVVLKIQSKCEVVTKRIVVSGSK